VFHKTLVTMYEAALFVRIIISLYVLVYVCIMLVSMYPCRSTVYALVSQRLTPFSKTYIDIIATSLYVKFQEYAKDTFVLFLV